MGSDTVMRLMLIAGFGFRASADIHSLANAFEKTATGGLLDGFSALVDKIDHPALTALARRYELPVYAVETETIKTMDTLTQSATVHKWRQTGSVAEAVALAPFTSPARLVCARQISDDGRAVCAVAQGERI